MPFDGLVTAALTYELNNILRGGKVDKIYQPLRDELFIQINSNKYKYTLFISSNSGNPRLYLTDEKSRNPVNPFPFCMLLRKHLIGGRISEIVQHGSDRVIEFIIIGSNDLGIKKPKRLIVEIMGKHSNVILVDSETETILDSIKHVSIDISRERQILPKLPYFYPPTRGKLSFYDVNYDNFDITEIQGVSNALKSEIMDSSDPPGTLKKMTEMIKEGNNEPLIYFDDLKKPVEFYVFPLKEYDGATSKDFNNVSSMLSYYYSKKQSSNRMNQKSSDLIKTLNQNLDKLRLKKQRLAEDIAKAEKGDTYKLYGELLTANMYNINKGESKVTLTNYYSNEEVTITVDPLLSPSENAQRYFKKYNKSKTALEEKTIQIKDADENIGVLESYLTYIENAETPEDIDAIRDELTEQGYLRKRKNQPVSKRKKVSFLSFKVPGNNKDEFTVNVGRNNKENDELTMKKAGSNDLWFHTKDIPGSHVILFTEGKEPGEKTILETASIAAYYSKARISQNVPVDYTRVKFVKKTSGAKPGAVIFTDNKTVYVNPQKPEEQD